MSKVLFIDYDGTLHDTDAKFAGQFDGMYGLTSQEVIDNYVRVHLDIVHEQFPEKHDDFMFHQRLLCDRLGRPYNEEEARVMAAKFEDAHWGRWTNPLFFADSLPFLDQVRGRYILCLTTGDYARRKADALEKAGGKSYFSHALDNTHLGIKGGSAYFGNALMSTNALPEDTVVIGDSLQQDIAAAKEVGIATVWVNRRGLAPEDGSPRPDYEARDLLEVLKYLDGH